MHPRPALLPIAIILLAAGTFFGCGPTEDDTPSAVAFDTTDPAARMRTSSTAKLSTMVLVAGSRSIRHVQRAQSRRRL